MQTFRSTVPGGFPFQVTTPSIEQFSIPGLSTKFQEAVDIASERLKEENLREFVYRHFYEKKHYRRRWLRRKLVRTEKIKGFHVDTKNDIFNHYNLEGIVRVIMEGNELVLGEGADGEADVFWKLKNRNKRGVVGFTYTSTIWQWTYRNWVMNMTAEELAGHLVHEWLHKLGGKHTVKDHAYRRYTATYAIGYYVGGRYEF